MGSLVGAGKEEGKTPMLGVLSQPKLVQRPVGTRETLWRVS